MTTATGPDATRRDEAIAAAHGARWITVAFVIVGLLNYGYAVLLTRFLDVAGYSVFAAGQSLILWASTVATVAVPWVLAQGLARARCDADRDTAIRFAALASAGGGLITATAIGVIATRFSGPLVAAVIAASTLIIFVGTTTTGWLQGMQRMRALAGLYVAENVLKNLAGLVLVVAGLRVAGALGAFGIGGLVMLAWYPRVPGRAVRPWLAALASRPLWLRTARIAGVQGIISLYGTADVVLVALLPAQRSLAASYQASAVASRVPLFIAGAVATAFFPSLSRHATGGPIAARAAAMYTAVALPVCAVLATMPAAVLAAVFPAQYAAMATLLKFTALAGLAAGAACLLAAFFQAADDYSCLPWLAAGLAGYLGALLAGWRLGGVTGLAAGGALGAAATALLLGYRLVRREGRAPLARISLAEPLLAAGLLVVLRPWPLPWLAAAAVVGLAASIRFFRSAGRAASRAQGRPKVVISSFDSPANPHYHGGGAAVVQTLAAALAGEFAVTVVTSARHRGTAARDGVCYRQLPCGWAGPRGGQLLFHAMLPFAARRIPHDVWIESFTPPFSTSFLPLFSPARVVGFAQNLSGAQMQAQYRLPFFLIERLGLRCYRDMMVLNGADRAEVLRRSPSARVRVIPNCLTTPAGAPERAIPGGRHILFLGRIETRQKGLDLLLDAYSKSGVAMPLLVAGGGTRQEERRLAELLDGGGARWLGPVSGQRKQELLEGSAFVVLPSRHEAFGLSALEGMSCGKPVVHFDLPALRWMDGDVRVPPFDVDALAGALRELAGDAARRQALGRAAFAAAQDYRPDRTADRYRALVWQVLGGQAAQPGGGALMPLNVLTEAIEARVPLVFVSPHLDDAALSCGGLMMHAAQRTQVTVVTIFTEGGHPPYTLSARRYLRQVGARDARALYQQRRAEDRAALEPLGITCLHAGLTDALFRRQPGVPPGRWRDRLLPELAHVYPVYRLQVTSGRIAAADAGTVERVCAVIRCLAGSGRCLLLAPLGVGRHVDHVLVHAAAARSAQRVVYYSDFPYNQRPRPRSGPMIDGLTAVPAPASAGARTALIESYRTQAPALFRDGNIPAAPEMYFTPGASQALPGRGKEVMM